MTLKKQKQPKTNQSEPKKASIYYPKQAKTSQKKTQNEPEESNTSQNKPKRDLKWDKTTQNKPKQATRRPKMS